MTDEWAVTRWWRVTYDDGLWCETSDEDEARDALATAPGGNVRLERLWETVPRRQWRSER